MNKDGEFFFDAEETVGEIIRWINREHMNAAKETPPNLDYMRAMQRDGHALESILIDYRSATAQNTYERTRPYRQARFI